MTAERPNNIMCNVVEECQTVLTTIHAKIKLKVFFKMRFPSCMLVVFQKHWVLLWNCFQSLFLPWTSFGRVLIFRWVCEMYWTQCIYCVANVKTLAIRCILLRTNPCFAIHTNIMPNANAFLLNSVDQSVCGSQRIVCSKIQNPKPEIQNYIRNQKPKFQKFRTVAHAKLQLNES